MDHAINKDWMQEKKPGKMVLGLEKLQKFMQQKELQEAKNKRQRDYLLGDIATIIACCVTHLYVH